MSALALRSGLHRLVAILALTTLSACGGGGGDSNGAAASPNTLDVAVTTDGDTVTPNGTEYRVKNPSVVKIDCPKACTFAPGTNNGVTLAQTATTGTQWSAQVVFGSESSSLTLKADAADGTTATVVLKPLVLAGGTATWSMDSLRWSRTGSTQGTSTATFDNQPVVTTHLTMTDIGRPCESASFRCSTVSVHFAGAQPGDYTIDPAFMTKGIKTPGTAWVNVKLTGGGTPYYNDDYRPTSGTLRVTKTGDTYIFSTVGSILVTRVAGPGGDPNAIAQMLFKLNSGF